MRTPSQREWLAAWEQGAGQGPIARALSLLSLALPDHSWDALGAVSVGGRNRALLTLRQAAFGQRLCGLAACARCGEGLEFECAAADLLTGEPADAPIVVEEDAYRVGLRLPNSLDLLTAAKAAPGEAVSVLLERCVTAARKGDEAVGARDLPSTVVAAAARRLDEADPQADMQVTLRCPNCGAETIAPFDIGSFLWDELDALAQRLLSEVHLLATAYGWSEGEILALSPLRRRSYLAMVQA